jgi:hypothetical protein
MTSRGGKVLVVGLCAMDHPDPLAHGPDDGLCSLRSCRNGWINCPDKAARADHYRP